MNRSWNQESPSDVLREARDELDRLAATLNGVVAALRDADESDVQDIATTLVHHAVLPLSEQIERLTELQRLLKIED
jgi:uncharacterized hydantoinase/oxoprolinase family protein